MSEKRDDYQEAVFQLQCKFRDAEKMEEGKLQRTYLNENQLKALLEKLGEPLRRPV